MGLLLKQQKNLQKLYWTIREIDSSYLCLQQFDEFCIRSACNDRKRKLCKTSQLDLIPAITVQKNVVPKIIKIGFIVETTEKPPTNILKNSWNWLAILIPATVWRILDIKCMRWPETEIMRNLNKSVELECKNYCQEKCRPKNHKYWVYCWNNFIHHSTHIFIRLHFIIHFGFIIN